MVLTDDLWGTGAAVGTARAAAKIVSDPSQINSPAIVVTSHTDPAWILFLPLIKGLVVEKRVAFFPMLQLFLANLEYQQ